MVPTVPNPKLGPNPPPMHAALHAAARCYACAAADLAAAAALTLLHELVKELSRLRLGEAICKILRRIAAANAQARWLPQALIIIKHWFSKSASRRAKQRGPKKRHEECCMAVT